MKSSPRAVPVDLRWMWFSLLWLLGAWLAWVPAAQAADDAPGRVGRVSEVQGNAWLHDEEANEWLELRRNRPLTGGDRVSVDPGARVELRIGSTIVRLDGNSQLDLNRLDDDRIDLFLHRGSLALRVRAAEVARELSVGTAEGRFLPQRTGHYRIDRERDTSYATAWSGELRFEAPDSALAIVPGRRAELWFERRDDRTHYSWLDTERDAFSDWVARDNRDEERAAANRYVSPEMTGWEDLDRHGRWDSHPEFGAIWYPTVVVADWAPYRYGHWAWVRPWGWTWVDDAPWGFAPSHYGRWVHWHGRWAWAPGTRVARPVFAPALVAWVGGPQASFSLTIGGRPAPAVGWVPLAPREVYRPSYRVPSGHWRALNPWTDADGRHGAPTRVPGGPVHYSHLGVPGAVSVAPADAMNRRAPVVPVRPPREPNWERSLRDSRFGHQAPAAPTQRVVPVPGGAVPVPPPPAPRRDLGRETPREQRAEPAAARRVEDDRAHPGFGRVMPAPATVPAPAPQREPRRDDRREGLRPDRPADKGEGRREERRDAGGEARPRSSPSRPSVD